MAWGCPEITSIKEGKSNSCCYLLRKLQVWGHDSEVNTLTDFPNLVFVTPIFHVSFPSCSRLLDRRATCILLGELLGRLSAFAGLFSIRWEGSSRRLCVTPSKGLEGGEVCPCFFTSLPLLSLFHSPSPLLPLSSLSFNWGIRLSGSLPNCLLWLKLMLLSMVVLNDFAASIPSPPDRDFHLLRTRNGVGDSDREKKPILHSHGTWCPGLSCKVSWMRRGVTGRP